jgi:drug/metabolite transporter (DMT)-like permease
VSGALWATASGAGFGLFQSLNRRAIRGIDDPLVSTFLQLAVGTVVLVAASLGTEDLSRFSEATAESIVLFGLAGLVHFGLGWSFLNLSQARIGAARTAPLITLTPLFGLALAAVALGEVPSAESLVAIVPIVAGAWLVAGRGRGVKVQRGSGFAFATAFMWALSAVMTVEALEGFDSPLLGVTLGMLAATAGMGAGLAARGSLRAVRAIAHEALALKMLAGAVVAVATWSRLIALDESEVGVVLALNLISVPIVLVLAPLMVGRHLEPVTARVWAGAALVIAGSLALIALTS